MKKIFFIFLLLNFSLANAEWVYVTENLKGTSLVDFKSIKKNSNFRKAWTRIIFIEPQDGSNGTFLSMKTYDEFDCKNDETRQLSILTFSDKEGSMLAFSSYDKGSFRPIVPDSTWSKVSEAVCKY